MEELTKTLIDLNAQYQKADAKGKAQTLKELIRIAEVRQRRLSALAKSDPGEVWHVAAQGTLRAAIPAPVRQYLEEEVELEGVLEVLVEDRDTGSWYLYFLQTATERLSLYFASHPLEYPTGMQVRVSGLRMESALVLR